MPFSKKPQHSSANSEQDHELEVYTPDPSAESDVDTSRLARLSADQQRRLAKDLQILRELAAHPKRPRVLVSDAAQKMGRSRSAVYKKLALLGGKAGTADLLLGAKPGYPSGVSRLLPRQDEIIDHWLDNYYLTRAKPSLCQTTKKVGDQCASEGLPRPSRPSLIRRLKLRGQRLITLKRDGPEEARKFTPKPGFFHVAAPRDVYQVDHTLIDVIIVDADGNPIGRAWLTVVLDVCTRLVVAFWVGLDPPSILRTGAALELAVADKSEWLKERGLSYAWPARGLMKVVHTDNGSDFRAEAITAALAAYGIEAKFRPVGRPHWGGHVERLLGTLMGACRILPGATHRSPKARGDYDSKGAARLTLDDLDAWMTHQILGVYHNSPHSGLKGLTPLEAWERQTAESQPLMPDDMRAFRIALLPEVERILTPQGVKVHGEEYSRSKVLFAEIGIGSRVRVKFDPRDLRYVYVRLGARWEEVGLRFPHHQPLPLRLRKQGLRNVSEESRSDNLVARQAADEQKKVIDQAAARSPSARRDKARLSKDEADAAAMRSRLSETPPELDDDSDWGGLFPKREAGQ